MFNWSDTRVEQLKTYWSDGLSAAQIAGEFGGLTRSAVIGKVHRLGLTSRRKATPGQAQARVDHHRHAMAIRRMQTRAARVPTPDTVPTAPQAPDTETLERIESERPAEFLGITFFDLKPHHCRYPRGEGSEMLFCGQDKIEGSSYCAACHARCHYTAPKAEAQPE